MNTTIQIERNIRWCVAFVILCIAAGGVTSRTHAESIMKMTLGANTAGNMQFKNGIFSALSDGLAGSSGDLDMSIDYVIGAGGQAFSATGTMGSASVTLTGMMVAAPPVSNGSFIVQAFEAGSLAVYDDSNSLLLSANLNKSGLQGALGLGGMGDKQGLFLGFGEVTGGLLARLLDPDSLQLRLKFPKIAGGFSLTPSPDSKLIDFTTWTSSIELMATPVPEPAIAFLVCTVVVTLVPARRRRRI